MSKFLVEFGDKELGTITSEEILFFLTHQSNSKKQSTKRLRYTLLKFFFNFVENTVDSKIQNPCNTPLLKKLFRIRQTVQWSILEKESVDEMIFKTVRPRNRLLLELMARGGMRIGEVLKIRAKDIEERKIILHEPKSGKETEGVFIPQKIADRLKDYIRNEGIKAEQRVFPLVYAGARAVVREAGKLAGITLTPHDLRRHAATFASRSGTPLEIVSKVILRHANLATTQRYLGKVSDAEAVRWIEHLYG